MAVEGDDDTHSALMMATMLMMIKWLKGVMRRYEFMGSSAWVMWAYSVFPCSKKVNERMNIAQWKKERKGREKRQQSPRLKLPYTTPLGISAI